MWFKNLQIYRLPTPWKISHHDLEAYLMPQAFAPCSSLEMQSQGWVSPRGNDQLVHVVNRQFLLKLDTEKKLLPAYVINQVTKARAAELEEQQGFPPGRKQTKELKEQVADELLPRAFTRLTSVWVWIPAGDLAHGPFAAGRDDRLAGKRRSTARLHRRSGRRAARQRRRKGHSQIRPSHP